MIWNKQEILYIFLRSDGTVFYCGNGTLGQSGLGGIAYTHYTPIAIPTLPPIVKMYGMPSETMIVKDINGLYWGWGVNTSGQLGLGNITNRTSPVRVWEAFPNIVDVSTSASTTSIYFLSVDENNNNEVRLYQQGYQDVAQGRLGTTTFNSNVPIQISSFNFTDFRFAYFGNMYSIYSNYKTERNNFLNKSFFLTDLLFT